MTQYLRLDQANKVIGIFDLEPEQAPNVVDGIIVVNLDPFPPGWPMGATPTEELYVVNGINTWVETAILSEVKAAKNAEINKWRLEKNRKSFIFATKEIACDELSALDIAATNGEICLTQQLPDNWAGGWKTVDNSYVAIPDVATWILFYKAMVQAGLANFQHSQNLKTALAAATTFEQVAEITW